MKDYEMVVTIPIKDVPDGTPIQEVKVTAELWLTNKIYDAKVVSFKELNQ